MKEGCIITASMGKTEISLISSTIASEQRKTQPSQGGGRITDGAVQHEAAQSRKLQTVQVLLSPV